MSRAEELQFCIVSEPLLLSELFKTVSKQVLKAFFFQPEVDGSQSCKLMESENEFCEGQMRLVKMIL